MFQNNKLITYISPHILVRKIGLGEDKYKKFFSYFLGFEIFIQIQVPIKMEHKTMDSKWACEIWRPDMYPSVDWQVS